MRALYEGYAEALSRYLLMPLPPWLADEPHKDNWKTVARLRKQAEDAGTTPASDDSVEEAAQKIAALGEHRHDF